VDDHNKQSCGSGLFIPDPDFSIPDPGSNSTVSKNAGMEPRSHAGIEPRTVATLSLAVRRSNPSARSHPLHG
jgi:hypothetical protein